MAAKTLPPQGVLLQLLRYDPETGKMFWRERRVEWFTDGDGRYTKERNAASWNRKNAGKEAFTTVNSGYREGGIFGIGYSAHRVIWKMVTGNDPEVIDHIDQDRSNNRWGNLRDTSHAQNLRNCGMSKNNTSGLTGVRWDAKSGKWQAQIMYQRRTHNLGFFPSCEEAKAARSAASKQFGFSDRHGLAGGSA